MFPCSFHSKDFFPLSEMVTSYIGDGNDSFPIDLNTNILENTTPFLRFVTILVHNSKFKQENFVCL